jgi:hypothetical protein
MSSWMPKTEGSIPIEIRHAMYWMLSTGIVLALAVWATLPLLGEV